MAKAAEDYARTVSDWFAWKEETQTFSDISPEPEVNDDSEAEEFVQIILWYQLFIAVKLTRALLSRINSEKDPQDITRDFDGSAKIALIGIERSLSAWKLMHDVRPERSKSIQEMMLKLEKLRVLAEREFPSARDFIRPGFDEISLDVLH